MSQSICIMRLSAIGDVCHAAAMVTRITQAWPDTKVTWVIGKNRTSTRQRYAQCRIYCV